MKERIIIWDENKNADNKRNHKVSFEVAQYVFADPQRIWRFDRSENMHPARNAGRLLVKLERFFFCSVY
jgi:uncharacterized DUF497 family protein